MKCPHCAHDIHIDFQASHLVTIGDVSADTPLSSVKLRAGNIRQLNCLFGTCPACSHVIVRLAACKAAASPHGVLWSAVVYPRTSGRAPLSDHVPEEFAKDYREAALVLGDSPKASAALSRRCLQHVLWEKAGVKHGNLSQEIQEVLDSGKLPSHLGDAIDVVRNIGNFAAHSLKDTNTGEVIDVEPGEAEWLLDTLEGLFDFYFVQPEVLAKKKAALDKKLADAGKPPSK